MIEYIEKLLNGRPVEWKKIEDISKNICSGGTPRSYVPEYYGGDIPWLRTQEVNFSEIWDTEVKITKEGLDSSNAKYIPANCIIIAMYGATVGRVGINKIPLTTNQACANIEVNEDIVYYRYLFYYLSSQYEYIKSLGTGTQTNINAGIVKKLLIPIPPLEVQEEVVRILDRFTELEAELEEKLGIELECRRKQYGYYKGQMFDSLSCPTKHITDIAVVKARVGWQRLTKSEYMHTGDYFLVTGTDFKNGYIDFNNCVYVSKERYEMDSNIIVGKGDILITKDGTLGKVAFVTESPNKPTTLNSGIFRIHVTDKDILPRYLFHYFTSKYFTDFVESVKTGSTIPHLTQQGLTSLNIPIPSIEEQLRIVRILDRFTELEAELEERLGMELELRRKQYEYYRERLLSFDR